VSARNLLQVHQQSPFKSSLTFLCKPGQPGAVRESQTTCRTVSLVDPTHCTHSAPYITCVMGQFARLSSVLLVPHLPGMTARLPSRCGCALLCAPCSCLMVLFYCWSLVLGPLPKTAGASGAAKTERRKA
jgi:hypothetical protein